MTCLQIVEFFTRRSTFVARTLVGQTRTQSELIAKIDELIARSPRPGGQDRSFERRCLPYVADRHNHITLYGVDLRDSPASAPTHRSACPTPGRGSPVPPRPDPAARRRGLGDILAAVPNPANVTRLDLRDNPLITDLHALLSAVREVRGLDRSADLPLDELICLGRHTTNRTGLRGLEYWSGLTGRSLGPLTTELTARDRQAVADRPR